MVNTKQHPEWAHKLLSADQIQKLSDLVHKIETETQGEIVPVLVRKSIVTGHVPLTVIGFLMITAFVIERTSLAVSWSLWPGWVHPLLLLFFLPFSVWLSQFSCIQRWLTSNTDEQLQVEKQAELEFYRGPVRKTQGRTGILIFVSYLEHRAVVLADQGIAQKVKPETWNEITQLLTGEFKQGRYYEGFEKALIRCGEILKTHVPAQGSNPNEICNQMVIRD